MINKVFFLKELKHLLKDPVMVKKVYELFEKVQRMEREERKEKQQLGIERARMQGKKLGRPKLTEPDNFPAIMSAWEKKRINAAEAAQMCGIGVSTFYRRVRDLRERGRRKGRD